MKEIIKGKIVEIFIGFITVIFVTGIGFYYTTQNDIKYIQAQAIIDRSMIKTNSLEIKANDKHLTDHDILNREISVKLDYISVMIEEIRKGTK